MSDGNDIYSTTPLRRFKEGTFIIKTEGIFHKRLIVPEWRQSFHLGTSSTEPDGNVQDGACSSKVEMVLPVGTSSTKTDEDGSSWYF